MTDTTHRRQPATPDAELRRLLDVAGVPFAVVDGEGHLRSASSGFGRLWGRTSTDLVGLHLLSVVPEDDQPEVLASLVRVLEGVCDPERCELRAGPVGGTGASGATDRRVLELILGRVGESELVAVVRDVTADERSERRRRRGVVELVRAVTTDPVTGLAGPVGIGAALGSAVRRSARHGLPFAAILAEVSAPEGAAPEGSGECDELAPRLADRLRARLRTGDEIGRDEVGRFVVVAEDLGDVQDAAGVAYRLLAATVEPLDLRGAPVLVGLTLGVAVADGTSSPEQVLAAAEDALARARGDGTGGFRIVDLRPGLAA